MQLMSHLLAAKGTAIWSTTPAATVLDALQLMADKDVGALLVLERTRLVGMFSEREYARKVVLEGRVSRDTPVRTVMITDFPMAGPDDTVERCMGLMTTRRVRHVPVMDGDTLLGVVSIGDLVKAMIDQQQFTIQQLEHYIKT
jgi:CBS domain-containing protein